MEGSRNASPTGRNASPARYNSYIWYISRDVQVNNSSGYEKREELPLENGGKEQRGEYNRRNNYLRRGNSGYGKGRRNHHHHNKYDSIPTLEIQGAESRKSYREFVLDSHPDITVDEAEKKYEK